MKIKILILLILSFIGNVIGETNFVEMGQDQKQIEEMNNLKKSYDNMYEKMYGKVVWKKSKTWKKIVKQKFPKIFFF